MKSIGVRREQNQLLKEIIQSLDKTKADGHLG
jgi:hypothetical protein